MSNILVKDLKKTYGKARGVDGICLEIEKGEIFGFIGPNGAGKSTTIRCIMDNINKNSGQILVNGKEIKRTESKWKEKIGYLPSEVNLYEDLTVEKMLHYSASFYTKDCSKKIDELVKRLEVDRKKKIDELSLGNLKKVGIILSMLHEPEILILDEATSGLDPLMQEVFYQLLLEEKKKGTTIFFSSHNLSEIKRVCDRVGIIKEGKLIKVDEIDNLLEEDFMIVKIETNEIEKICEELKCEKVEENRQYRLMYQGEINRLINILAKYEIKKLLIEEPEVEDIFMHYYK